MVEPDASWSLDDIMTHHVAKRRGDLADAGVVNTTPTGPGWWYRQGGDNDLGSIYGGTIKPDPFTPLHDPAGNDNPAVQILPKQSDSGEFQTAEMGPMPEIASAARLVDKEIESMDQRTGGGLNFSSMFNPDGTPKVIPLDQAQP